MRDDLIPDVVYMHGDFGPRFVIPLHNPRGDWTEPVKPITYKQVAYKPTHVFVTFLEGEAIAEVGEAWVYAREKEGEA